MISRFVFILCLLCFALSRAYALDFIHQADPKILCIETQLKDKSSRSGTGFFIGDSLVATVYHQVKDGRSFVYRTDGTRGPARLLGYDAETDLALLRVPNQSGGYLEMASDFTPKLGQDVFTLGCPLGYDHTLSRGIVSHVKRTLADRPFVIQVDMTVNKGNSGGPLLNSQGQILGVIWGKHLSNTNINFAIPVKDLAKLVKEAGLDLLASSNLDTLLKQALSTKNAHEQIQIYKKILSQNNGIAEAHYNLGLAYFKISDYQKAEQSFKKAIQVKKPASYYQAQYNLGLSLHKLGRLMEARDALINVVTIKPNYSPVYLKLGFVYEELVNKRSSKQAFKRYLELNPNSSEASVLRRRLNTLH